LAFWNLLDLIGSKNMPDLAVITEPSPTLFNRRLIIAKAVRE